MYIKDLARKSSSSGVVPSQDVPFLRVPIGVPRLLINRSLVFGYTMGQLNELQIKAAQLRAKEYLLADGEGLYLRVRPTGKTWVYRYKEAGREAKLGLRLPLKSGVLNPC